MQGYTYSAVCCLFGGATYMPCVCICVSREQPFASLFPLPHHTHSHPTPLPHSLKHQNFFPGPQMSVTIGAAPCSNVTITDPEGLGALECIAPPGPGIGSVQLVVQVTGSGSGSSRFLYAPPSVHRIVGSPCDADGLCTLQVRSQSELLLVLHIGAEPRGKQIVRSSFALWHGPPLRSLPTLTNACLRIVRLRMSTRHAVTLCACPHTHPARVRHRATAAHGSHMALSHAV